LIHNHPRLRRCARTRVFPFLSWDCAMYDSDLIRLWIPIIREARIGEVDRDLAVW
jgi:hypothetical protein